VTTTDLAGLGRQLDGIARNLERTLTAAELRPVAGAAGQAAKAVATRTLVEVLGGDMAMSNLTARGGVPRRLGVGYDVAADGQAVTVNHRPAGLWVLADDGRKRAGVIFPRSATGRRGKAARRGAALAVPGADRPRSSSRYTASRGTGVLRKAIAREYDAAPEAAADAYTVALRRAMGRS
jgi:hypothetical protein